QPSATPDKPWRRCAGERPLGRLPALRHRDVLLVYTDLGHTSTPRMWSAAEAFVSANIAPPTPLERLLGTLRGR
ncbi:hypothetical protein, partial [Deinococcus pimensis]|uniref:hypothetical protein n=1 Tax=Deinococcus pimensis TaxID=309888 RepID=UPI000483CD3A